MPIAKRTHFVYRQNMIVEESGDIAVARIAAAIGDPSRARILCSLLDGHARTSTELAIVAKVSPSTASVHLAKLKAENLVRILVQGKHRYYSLHGPEVSRVLEALLVAAGGASRPFTPATPLRLRHARRCYDHMAGTIAVALHDRFLKTGWIIPGAELPGAKGVEYDLSAAGEDVLRDLNIDIPAMHNLRRRFAYACLDWSERKPHIGGALGAALLHIALKEKWAVRDLDSRALSIARQGYREFAAHFGLSLWSQNEIPQIAEPRQTTPGPLATLSASRNESTPTPS